MEYTYNDDSDNFLTFDWITFTWLTAERNLFPSQRAFSGVEYRGPWEPSSETQGQSVGSGETAERKFSSKDGRAPGYRLSPNHFQKFKPMLAPDWAQKMLCIIVPNRRTVSPEFFSWVRTRRLLSRHTCPSVHQACACEGNFYFLLS